MLRPANAIDFWRGFALVTIFLNHIPGIWWGEYTHRNYSLSDSAELFVFLAGWSLRNIVGKPDDPTPAWRLVLRLGGRAITIYAAHILIITLAIGMLATASLLLANPLLLEWHNAAAVFQDPVEAHIGLVLLTHQLGYFDILPLYVVLMLAAPGIALIDRYAPGALLPLSLALYIGALVTQVSFPTWPVEGQWIFNPLAWQIVFILGFATARPGGPVEFVRRHILPFRLVSLAIVLVALVVVRWEFWPDPARVPQPTLFFVIGKSFVTPPRLIQFLALVILFSVVYTWIEKLSSHFCSFLSMLGRNSLEVFCMGSILSLLGQIVRYALGGGFAVDTAVLIFGVAAMAATAWVTEWRERTRLRAPAPAVGSPERQASSPA
jgi:hypothetical protein